MVKEITDIGEFEREVSGPGLVVVDFFTTWCGPCKAIAPVLESLAAKYPDVKFIKVDIEKNEDIARPRNISSIPTFHFMVKGSLVDEMKGGNPQALEQKIIQHKVDLNPFQGSGHKLVSEDTDPNLPALSAREARLKAFASLEGPRKPINAAEGDTGKKMDIVEDADDEEEAMAKAMSLSLAGKEEAGDVKPVPSAATAPKKSLQQQQEEADYSAAEAELDAEENKPLEHVMEAAGGQEWEEEMVPVPVNEELLAQLLEMGFPDVRARKSLVHGGSLDGAMVWLGDHQDDPDIDQPYLVRKADTIPKPPLSEEEKAARTAAIREKMAQRKADRVKQEKADEIRREKERRERGQKMEQTQEERQRLQRKREAERMKREKEDAAKERQRLRAEIARDKEIRKKNKGVLPSVLGVDGYNPSIIQYDQPVAEGAAPPPAADSASSSSGSAGAAATPAPAPVAKKASSSSSSSSAPAVPVADTTDPAVLAQRVDSAIQTVMRYRTGGDGGNALKLLHLFVKNLAENPEEPK